MLFRSEKAQECILSDIFGTSYIGQNRWGNVWPPIVRCRPVKEKAAENVVAEALIQAQKQMTVIMDNLTWWRMLLRLDEISYLVNVAVERTLCPDLERKVLTIFLGCERQVTNSLQACDAHGPPRFLSGRTYGANIFDTCQV